MFNFFRKNKPNEVDEVVLRTAYAFNSAISVGQKIMASTLSKLKELKQIDNDNDLDFTDEQATLFSKEIAKLSFFWLTRDIWTYIVKDESDAKKANLLLFSWFKDKYGVEHKEIEPYAKAAGTSEEVQIFGKNVAKIFDCYGAIEILELNKIPISYFEEYIKNTKDAFTLSIQEIQGKLKRICRQNKNHNDFVVRKAERKT